MWENKIGNDEKLITAETRVSYKIRYAFLRTIEFLEQNEWVTVIEILGHLGKKVWVTYKKIINMKPNDILIQAV